MKKLTGLGTYNRTIEELKKYQYANLTVNKSAYNRTIEELKNLKH